VTFAIFGLSALGASCRSFNPAQRHANSVVILLFLSRQAIPQLFTFR
jgi:hypothetical protein